LKESQQEAGRQFKNLQVSNPFWATKFRVLEAEAALWRGLFDPALQLPNPPLDQPDIAIPTFTLKGVANTHLHVLDEAQRNLDQADRLCTASFNKACNAVTRAHGVLALERRQLQEARRYFQQSLEYARLHDDPYMAATALLNLGDVSLFLEHFDEAVDKCEEAYKLATAIGAKDTAMVAAGNLGWAYYKLGDSVRALDLSLEANHRAEDLSDLGTQAAWLTNAGYVYMDRRDFSQAEDSFRHALVLEQSVHSKDDVYNALRVLARLSLQTNNLERASGYAGQALVMAQTSKNRLDELYPLLAQGQIAARRADADVAERTYREVEQDANCPASLRWEAQYSLARLYEDRQKPDLAEREYRAALATFEAARETVRHEDAQLSFLTNASRIYDDYVHFLLARGLTNEALRWADHNRARTLAEGLGLLSKKDAGGPPPLDAPGIAKRENGTLLFYSLEEKQSYLWAVTAQKIVLFSLPSKAVIDAAVQRYRESMSGQRVVFEPASQDGIALYRALVEPARALLPKNGKVVIIPDGSLNNLNFETLLVGDPKPHYWIEDATITNASSLRLLGHMQSGDQTAQRRLLLIGNSVAPNPRYPELPKAAMQVESVARHFPTSQRVLLTREQATPDAYVHSKLEQFSHIHFVAHGTASRLIPLDSAIVLSNSSTQGDSFKLYAREIIRHPLRAELVTISACYGAEGREYSGEGLVGLSWAFLKAGAHNVIAALWAASDASTERLMSKFYDELDKGATADRALRSAKLSLLQDTNFRDPLYWAPFQLYAGSYRNTQATSNSKTSPAVASAKRY
jgi:CHAT domain-containing protein